MDSATPPDVSTPRTGAPAADNKQVTINRDVIIVNTEPGYPSHIAAARYWRDVRDAASVRQLALAVLGRKTDGLLHFAECGTYLVLKGASQAKLWGDEQIPEAALTDIIPSLNNWMVARAKVVRGTRNVETRVKKSDDTLDELGFADLRRVLLGLAAAKQRKIQIFDAAGRGGVLDILPRGQLIPAHGADTRASADGSVRVLSIEPITRIVESTGSLFEAASAHVASGVVVGKHAHVHNPHKTTSRALRAQYLEITENPQEKDHGQY